MDRARATEGTGGGRKPQRPVWFQWGLLASLLAPLSACAGASPPDPGYAAPPQDSLAAVIRNLRAGEDAVAVVDAVAAAARITPEHLDGKLRDAMTHALTLSINAEDNVLADLGAVLEEALGAAWSQEELAATMREIPSEMGLPTPRQRVAARLAAAIDLAIALGDSASLRTVRSLAADPAEMVRAGVAARDAEVLVADVRQKIGWTPPARSRGRRRRTRTGRACRWTCSGSGRRRRARRHRTRPHREHSRLRPVKARRAAHPDPGGLLNAGDGNRC